MRIPRTALLSVATVGLIGAVAYAADAPRTHVLTIQLPGGGVEQVTYSGDVAPRIIVRQGSPTDADSAFGAISRIRAEMDREMAAMLQHPLVMPPMPAMSAGQLQRATAGNAPAGARSYSVVSTFSGGHECTQSVEMTSQGAGQPPKVVRQTSGDCGAAEAAPSAPVPPPPAAIPPGRRTSI